MVDAVAAILDSGISSGETFNIGNPAEVETTLGLARRVARLVSGASLRFQPMSRAEVRARVPNIEKAKRLLGFEPRVDLETGLVQTLAWFRAKRDS
jgi:nucleoside-diphosphate-sugar epimerase